MKIRFKILTVLISFFILAQSVTAFAENNQSTAVPEATDVNYELLNSLGIVTQPGNGTDAVTKGMYVQYILNMLKSTIQPAKEQLFFDVPLTGDYADICYTAYNLGLIKGRTDGNSGFEEPVTLNEAVCISVRALNASVLTMQEPGSMSAYTDAAMELGLYNGVLAEADGTLNRKNVLKLLCNMLDSKCIATMNGYEFYLEDSTILERYYKIHKSRGIVESNHYGNIYGGSAVNSGYVIINDVRYEYNDTLSKKMLGHQVEYYYKDETDSGISQIVYMCSKSNALTLDVEDAVLHKSNSFEYSISEDKTKKVSLSSTAVTLLNGERVTVAGMGMNIPKHGEVTLIDNDNSGSYDVIIYDEYVISVATSVNEKEMIIYSKKGKFAVLSLEKYESHRILDNHGNEVKLSDITKDSVLNIRAYGEDRIVEITVCKETKEFTIISSEMKTYGNKTCRVVKDENNNEYIMVSDFADITDDNGLIVNNSFDMFGKKYKFSLNSDGKLVAVLSWSEASDYQYGYIINSKPASGLKNPVVRILTEKNEIKDYTVADKVYVTNGISSDNVASDVFVTDYAAESVIRFKLDAEGKLKNVEIPQAEGSEVGLRIDKVLPTGMSASTRFNSANSLLGGQIALNEDTRIFFCPTDDENKNDKKWYSVNVGLVFTDGRYLPSAVAYKYDNDVYADVLVVSANSAVIDRDSPIMLVENIIDIYDPESGGARKAVKGYVNGNKITYCFENDAVNLSTVESYSVDKGDVIRFAINAVGDICILHPIFDYSEEILYYFELSTTKYYAFYESSCQVYGKMNDILEGKYMQLINSDDTEQEKYYYPITATTSFYEYDENSRGDKFSLITVDDIPTLKRNSLEESNVLIITVSTETPLVVVYN